MGWRYVYEQLEPEPRELTPEEATAWKWQLEPPPLPSYPLHRECVRSLIASELNKLTPKERAVIKWRFGIGCRDLTGEEIGNLFGVTRERIFQIERKTLRKLRRRLMWNLDAWGVERRT